MITIHSVDGFKLVLGMPSLFPAGLEFQTWPRHRSEHFQFIQGNLMYLDKKNRIHTVMHPFNREQSVVQKQIILVFQILHQSEVEHCKNCNA